ncbi:MAG: T9SS type A sorting domain-containing protein, partial [Flavobacteriales bacterium]
GGILCHEAYYYIMAYVPKRFLKISGDQDQTFSISGSNPNFSALQGGGAFVQSDGKILFTGDHHLGQQYGPNAPGYYSVLRVNTDASLDTTYHFRKTDGVVWSIEPTTQGRFLLSGVYNTYEGIPAGRILRIWPDGSLDSTFHCDIIKGFARYLLEQPDGRIIAGGHFVLPNDPDTMHLIRLMPNGALDPSFNNHTEYKHFPQYSFADFGFDVNAVLQLGDGTIMVGGSFTHIDGQLRRGIALLDSTGHLLNASFTGQGCGLTHGINSTSLSSAISSISVAPDGSIFLAGSFHGFDDGTVNDPAQRMICKLHGLTTGVQEREAVLPGLRVFPNPGSETLHVETGMLGSVHVQVLDGTGRAVMAASSKEGTMQIDCGTLAPGVYLVEVRTDDGRRTVKWTKR